MARLLIHVEGQTEENFVNDLLAPHLYALGYQGVSARLLGNARQRSHRGGVRPWAGIAREIANHLKADVDCFAAIMVDYYGMPTDWPGRTTATRLPVPGNAQSIQSALLGDISLRMGSQFNPLRFIPCVLLHEYEALLFTDCNLLAATINQPQFASALQSIRDGFATPEHINDSPQTAPSKQLLALYPGYQKTIDGVQAAKAIGLARIRQVCVHFDAWVKELEARAPGPVE
jgi:hypothetical protein